MDNDGIHSLPASIDVAMLAVMFEIEIFCSEYSGFGFKRIRRSLVCLLQQKDVILLGGTCGTLHRIQMEIARGRQAFPLG